MQRSMLARPRASPGGRYLPPGICGSNLLNCQRGVDELLAVGNGGCALFLRAFLRELWPGVLFLRRHSYDLDIVLLERVDHRVAELLAGGVEELLGCFASI